MAFYIKTFFSEFVLLNLLSELFGSPGCFSISACGEFSSTSGDTYFFVDGIVFVWDTHILVPLLTGVSMATGTRCPVTRPRACHIGCSNRLFSDLPFPSLPPMTSQ